VNSRFLDGALNNVSTSSPQALSRPTANHNFVHSLAHRIKLLKTLDVNLFRIRHSFGTRSAE
jgi:hypothetical protein